MGGDRVLRKGKLGTVVKVDHLTDPPSYTVDMDDGGEVGTEGHLLQKASEKTEKHTERKADTKPNTSRQKADKGSRSERQSNGKKTAARSPSVESAPQRDRRARVASLSRETSPLPTRKKTQPSAPKKVEAQSPPRKRKPAVSKSPPRR